MVQFKQSVLLAFTLMASSPVDVVSFTPSSTIPGRFTSSTYRTLQALDASKNNYNDNNDRSSIENKVVGGASAFVTGLVIAAQVAFADPSTLVENTIISPQHEGSTQSSSVIVSAFGAPNGAMAGSFETLDFSLPSYSEATKSGSATKSSDAPPAFTPSFGDLKLPEPSSKVEEVPKEEADEEAKAAAKKAAEEEKAAQKKAAEEEKAAQKKAAEEEKAAAKKAAEEEKAAKEKAKEEEKLAKEKEAAEKAAAAEKKKAELEARKQAEKEKQEEMIKRNKEAEEKAKAADAAKPIDVVVPPTSSSPAAAPAPESPIEIPDIKLPEIDIKMPEMDFKLPSFSAPKFEAPSFDIPAPAPAAKVEVPTAPKLDLPPPPKPAAVSTPPPAAVAPVAQAPVIRLEPQEVRDEKARDAKNKFKDLDTKARDLEEQAKDARRIATGAKKEAEIAKAAACETRPGGKFLCVRPFGIGY